MRELTIRIRNERGEWDETYREGERASFPVGEPDLSVWAYTLVTRYNAGCRPGEARRYVVGIEVREIPDVMVKREHRWTKTNLVTIMHGSRSYDTARCEVCGVTAKRFGVGEHVRDSKYGAKRYETCPGCPVV
jgi:hypothetical protein